MLKDWKHVCATPVLLNHPETGALHLSLRVVWEDQSGKVHDEAFREISFKQPKPRRKRRSKPKQTSSSHVEVLSSDDV